MTDLMLKRNLEAILLDQWPYVRSRLSEVVSSRRLEEIDDLLGSIEELVDRYLEENRGVK